MDKERITGAGTSRESVAELKELMDRHAHEDMDPDERERLGERIRVLRQGARR